MAGKMVCMVYHIIFTGNIKLSIQTLEPQLINCYTIFACTIVFCKRPNLKILCIIVNLCVILKDFLRVTIEWKRYKKATSVYDLGWLHVLPLLLFNNRSVFTHFRWTYFVCRTSLLLFFFFPAAYAMSVCFIPFCLVCISARTSPGSTLPHTDV